MLAQIVWQRVNACMYLSWTTRRTERLMIDFFIETEVSEWFHKSLIDKVLLTCKSDKKSMWL